MIPMLNKSFPDGVVILALAVVVTAAIFAAPCGAEGPVKVVDVAAGHGLSVVLLDNGTVWTWGECARGALGIGMPRQPVDNLLRRRSM